MRVFSIYLAGNTKLAAFTGLLVLLWALPAARAQDSLAVSKPTAGTSVSSRGRDSIPVNEAAGRYSSRQGIDSGDSLSRLHNPRRAALLSAVLPGLGQAYNHKYWKIPIAYIGLATATGFFVSNYKQYLIYRDAYRLSYSGQLSSSAAINTALTLYSQSDLQIIRDGYRQYVDYSVLAFVGVYFLNILDAVVDAQMYYFNISNNISLHLEPSIQGGCAGLGLVIGLDRPASQAEISPQFIYP